LDIRAKHDYDNLKADAARVLKTLEPMECSVHTTEGKTYIMRMLPYQTVDNTIGGVVLTFVDVSNVERARQEIEQLRREQERGAVELDAMLNRLPVGVTIWKDVDGRQMCTNPAAATVLGVDPGEKADWSLVKLYRGEQVLSAQELPILRAFQTGSPVEAEMLSVHRPDGSRVDVEVSAWPIKDESGAVGSVVGVLIDHTRRLREFRLRAAQQSTIADLGILALLTNDVGSVMRRVAESVREVLPAARCEVWRLDAATSQLWLQASASAQETNHQQITVPADPDTLGGYTLASEQPETFVEAQAHFPYPAYLDNLGMACSMSVIIKTENQTWGVLSVQDDHSRQFLSYETNFLQSVADLLGGVLQRKQLEIGHGEDQRRQAFAEAEDRMHQAERLASLRTLAAGIVHEVNNPLNSILVNAELGLITLDGPENREKIGDILRTIIKEAKRGGSITRTVLQFSKADRYTPKGRADLNNLIERVRDHVAPVLQQHNASLELEVDKHLPRLEVNQIAMEQAMINLISNAAQAGASNVAIRTERDDRYARIVVIDDGDGIPREEIKYIFDPFYTTRRAKGGSGLGLSLVHRIVADHNGTVEAYSNPGKGAEFVVRLPLAQESDNESRLED
jgi:PAS domain S-box-containing protein